MKNRKISKLVPVCISLGISLLLSCCGNQGMQDTTVQENSQDIETEQINQTEVETQEQMVDPNLPEGAIVDEVYEGVQGLTLETLKADTEVQYCGLVNVAKKYHFDGKEKYYYQVFNDQEEYFQAKENQILFFDFVTGVVNFDTNVYLEPDLSSEKVNFAINKKENDDVIIDGVIIDIDTKFEDEEFYHVFYLDKWDGYIAKDSVSVVENDGFIHGTYTHENAWRLQSYTNYMWDVSFIGEIQPGESFVVLCSWMYADYSSQEWIAMDDPDEYMDSYFILTESGSMGYIPIQSVEIE